MPAESVKSVLTGDKFFALPRYPRRPKNATAFNPAANPRLFASRHDSYFAPQRYFRKLPFDIRLFLVYNGNMLENKSSQSSQESKQVVKI